MNKCISRLIFLFILSTLFTNKLASLNVALSPAHLSYPIEQRTSLADDKYHIIYEIGKGTYSTVFLAEDRVGELVAIKKYAISDRKLITLLEQNGMTVNTYVQQLAQKELQIGQLTDHPNIVKVKEAWFEDSAAYVVMNYIEGQTFDCFKDYSLETRMIFLQQFLGAVEHLLSRNIIVDDLWSENLLISNDTNLTLIDLGGFEFINDETDLPMEHFLGMIEQMIISIGGKTVKIVDNCKDLLPQKLRKETIAPIHVTALLSWIEALQKELETE